jgi:tetratricopeptide (TPR) repeat protein
MDKGPSEIVKLTERISKDPKSKLFVPLAEEYKKIGDVEMAIYVLTEGLKNNPGYITARSFLGRLLLEKGDLAGAQKELEDVVKAIPDNLLAQRKLGDLYILQTKPSEALKHYQLALSLNSRDEEIASLVADLEAGNDVSARIQQPHPQPSPEPEKPAPQEIKQQPPTTPTSASVPTPIAGAPHEKRGEPIQIPEAAVAPAPHPVADAEEPEEVLFVEPLENEPPAQEPHEEGLDFLTEQPQTHTPELHMPELHTPEPLLEEFSEPLFESTDQVTVDLSPQDQAPAEPVVFPEAESKTPQPVVAEELFGTELMEPDLVEAELVEEEPVAMPAPDVTETPMPVAAEEPFGNEFIEPDLVKAELVEEEPVAMPASDVAEETPEKTDDFKTDTLAELYIAQGFFEKAIDIYEQMLADNPNSKGLQDKLERVKTMAAASAAPPVQEQKAETDIFAEPKAYSAQEEELEQKKPDDFFGQPEEFVTAADAEAQQSTAKDMPQPVQDAIRAKPAFTDFEPREYVPPKPEPVGAPAQKAHAAPKSPKASRKETIDRLESWLRNIKKES